jgi:seryl-tRNA synthetase
MRIEKAYCDPSETPASLKAWKEENSVLVGLEASLRSSDSLKEIITCARERASRAEVPSDRLTQIEELCEEYQQHQEEVRKLCLNLAVCDEDDIPADMDEYTDHLMRRGRELFARLSKVVLQFA